MKKILIAALAIFFASCDNKTQTPATESPTPVEAVKQKCNRLLKSYKLT